MIFTSGKLRLVSVVLSIALCAILAYQYRIQLIIYWVQSCVFLMAQVEKFSPSDSLALSTRARAFNRLLRMIPFPESLETHRALQKPVPLQLDSSYYRVDYILNGSLFVQDITKSCLKAENKTAILYLHGGAFVFGSASFHANLVFPVISETSRSLNKNICMDILFLEYGLCPENPLEKVLEQVHEAYKYLENQDQYSRINVMGDSAGGSVSTIDN